MESALQLKNDMREKALSAWLLNDCQLPTFTLQAMQGDASFRRYLRVKVSEHSFVAMDAPPEKESCHSFIAIAKALRAHGLQAPEVFFADTQQGFLLLSDFGDKTYLRTLNHDNADSLYKMALRALSHMQACQQVADHLLPTFSADFMQQEWAWHKEWFTQKLLNLKLEQETELDNCFQILMESALAQPRVFMHRDYHAGNLMVLTDEVGILDFQDAFRGPVTYDVVSLLRDCYIDWPAQKIDEWLAFYFHCLNEQNVLTDISFAQFKQWFDLMGLERHLKALFTFARKKVRDNQPQYLAYIPRTLHYIQQVSSQYPTLSPLHDYSLLAKKAFEATACAR